MRYGRSFNNEEIIAMARKLYGQSLEEAYQKAYQEAYQKGLKIGERDVVIRYLKRGCLSLDEAASELGMSIEEVQKIIEEETDNMPTKRQPSITK